MLPNLYLANPGIGWQNSPLSTNVIALPETVAYALRHTIAWDALNPSKDRYDWTPLDVALQQAISEGKQLSFRVYTMTNEGPSGAKIPDWVLAEGARLLPSGEPDYSNCIYQQEWGRFVSAMAERYDGEPNIAFIDISGYGDFNEWSWQNQTAWDDAWQTALNARTPDAAAFQSLDGQARRRLADIFLGGSFQQHACRDQQGQVEQVDYAYSGFQKTQLVMPFAGIRQSTQYVRWRRADVGFRYDCLGRTQDDRMVMEAAAGIWRTAPVVFELCSSDQFSMSSAQEVLQQSHGSLVHDNGYNGSPESLLQLLLPVGYRYVLKSLRTGGSVQAGRGLPVVMVWQNVGLAPCYAKMGEEFRLHVFLADASGQQVLLDDPLPDKIAAWMPAEAGDAAPRDNSVAWVMQIPQDIQPATYDLQLAIVDERTGLPLQLAFDAPAENGRYVVAQITVEP